MSTGKLIGGALVVMVTAYAIGRDHNGSYSPGGWYPILWMTGLLLLLLA